MTSPQEPAENQAIEVFFSYAHEDEELRDRLARHLSLLERQQVIRAWHDRDITGGAEWQQTIEQQLNSAQIILLLVSSDFIASDFCWSVELERAMQRHEEGAARVIPIILRAVDWRGAPFSKLGAFPKDGKPITSWNNQDEAFADIAEGIRRAVESFKKPHIGDFAPSTALTNGKRRRLEDKLRDLQQEWDQRSELLRQLREALGFETSIPHKIQLRYQIQQEEAQLEKIDNRLTETEQILGGLNDA